MVIDMNTKEKILNTAQTLFNQLGYDKVTMRQIAQEAEIGVGNLTYYFPKKIDIAKQLLKNKDIIEKTGHCKNLSQLNQRIRRMVLSLYENKFFFLAEYDISRDEDFIRRNSENVNTLRENLLLSFKDLVELGYFNPSFDEKSVEAVTDMIMYAHLTWITNSKKHFFKEEKNVDEFMDMHWKLLYVYLSDKGIEEYTKTIF